MAQELQTTLMKTKAELRSTRATLDEHIALVKDGEAEILKWGGGDP